VIDSRRAVAELDQRIPFLLSELGTHVADDFKRRLGASGPKTPSTWS
jgi:hypothetical protein